MPAKHLLDEDVPLRLGWTPTSAVLQYLLVRVIEEHETEASVAGVCSNEETPLETGRAAESNYFP